VAFWVGPISIVSWRVGTMLLLLAGSWRWLLNRTVGTSNALLVFGRTSLFVYWVHVELAYGNFSYPLHHALRLPWAIAAYVTFTLLMLGCAMLWLRRLPGPIVPAHMRASSDLSST
jgi:succinate-acetate transporter protein